MSTTILEQLHHHACKRPDQSALVEVKEDGTPARTLTYRQYHQAVATAAQAIRSMTAQDAVVAVQLPNCLSYPVAFLGVLASGRTVFPMHPALTPREVATAAQQSRTGWIITDRSAPPGLSHLGRSHIDTWLESQADAPTLFPNDRDTPGSMLLQSSGTTGLPKIVHRSAKSMDAVASQVVHATGLTPDDQVLAAIPLCHSYGIEHGVLAPLWAGATLYICPGFFPEVIASMWSRLQRAVVPAVPVMIDMLAQHSKLPVPGQRLKMIYSAGSTLPTTAANAFAERFGHHVGQLYGSSEIGSVTFGHAGTTPLNEGEVGRPVDDVSIRIFDIEHPHPSSPLPLGMEGQIAVRAASMLDGYLGHEVPTFIDGHVLTGDLGRLDPDGSLYITGRVKTLIEVGGMKVNPMEVERVLCEHPGVAECVVVPNRITQTLDRVTAFLVPCDSANPPSIQGVRAHARATLSSYKMPRSFNFIDALPRNALGKVDRQALMETIT